MKITQQLNIEGPLAYCKKRLHHEPNTVFWLLVELCDKCPSISLQYAKSLYKDTFSKKEINQALQDLAIIAPLWGIQPPTKDGPNYDDVNEDVKR
ncbi:hypothetical protein ACOS7Q_24950 [Escherichia coli]|uniref:hypothetical protein n=1 Tax=Escherichia coli TaxID=562 RepID=UPI003B9B7BA5